MASNSSRTLYDGDVLRRAERLLHTAVSENRMTLVTLLIHKGVDINSTDERGMTPLHVAIESFNEPIATLLLERGANHEIKDLDGRTPYDYLDNDRIFPALAALMRNRETRQPKETNTTTAHGRHGNLPLKEKLRSFKRDLKESLDVCNNDTNIPQYVTDQLSKFINDFKDIYQQVRELVLENSSGRDSLKRMYEKNLKNVQQRHMSETQEIIRQVENLASRGQQLHIDNENNRRHLVATSQSRVEQPACRPTIRPAFPVAIDISHLNPVKRNVDCPFPGSSATLNSPNSYAARQAQTLQTMLERGRILANRGGGNTNNTQIARSSSIPMIRPVVVRLSGPRPPLDNENRLRDPRSILREATNDYDYNKGPLVFVNSEQNTSSLIRETSFTTPAQAQEPSNVVSDIINQCIDPPSYEDSIQAANNSELNVRKRRTMDHNGVETGYILDSPYPKITVVPSTSSNPTEDASNQRPDTTQRKTARFFDFLTNPERSSRLRNASHPTSGRREDTPIPSRSDDNSLTFQRSSLRSSCPTRISLENRTEIGPNQERRTLANLNDINILSTGPSSSSRNWRRTTASMEQRRNEIEINGEIPNPSIAYMDDSSYSPEESFSNDFYFRRQSSLRNTGRRQVFLSSDESGHEELPTPVRVNDTEVLEDNLATNETSEDEDCPYLNRQTNKRLSERKPK